MSTPGEPERGYNGWENWQTWTVNLFLNGDYATDADLLFFSEVHSAAISGAAVLKEYVGYILERQLTRVTAPAARLFVTDALTAHLDAADWETLAEHHRED